MATIICMPSAFRRPQWCSGSHCDRPYTVQTAASWKCCPPKSKGGRESRATVISVRSSGCPWKKSGCKSQGWSPGSVEANDTTPMTAHGALISSKISLGHGQDFRPKSDAYTWHTSESVPLFRLSAIQIQSSLERNSDSFQFRHLLMIHVSLPKGEGGRASAP